MRSINSSVGRLASYNIPAASSMSQSIQAGIRTSYHPFADMVRCHCALIKVIHVPIKTKYYRSN